MINPEHLQFVLASAISYKKLREKVHKFAGERGKLPAAKVEELYIDFGYNLSLEIIDKIDLATIIGQAHMDRLYEILKEEKDYNIFTLLIDHDREGEVLFHTAAYIQEVIDDKYALQDIQKNSIYQRFELNEKLRQYFYPGNELFNYRSDMKPDEAIEIAQKILANANAHNAEQGEFYPKFREEIEAIIGKGNYYYDSWEFGGKEISLFWYIRKEVYANVMKKIGDWLKYLEIEDLVRYQIVQDI